MKNNIKITWLSKPLEHNYPAAESYLSLIYSKSKAADHVRKLMRVPVVWFKAKDIFRASGLSLLGVSNFHIVKDHKKILAGQKISPLLLLRDSKNSRLIIADGYHRLCAVYAFDEDALVPCKIV